MIAWIIEEKHAFPVVLKRKLVPFQALGHDMYFIFDGNEYHLRFPYGVQYVLKSQIMHQATSSIEDITTGKRCVLCYSIFDRYYDSFHKYKIPNAKITIGSSIENDIYLADHHLQDTHFVIDFDTKQYEDLTQSCMCSINGEIYNHKQIHDLDHIQVCNLQIIICCDFIMINQVENVHIKLQSFCLPELASLKTIPNHTIEQEYRTVTFHQSLQIQLEEPMQDERRQRPALIYTLGPALTMSSASLCAGMLSIYNGYMNGRDMLELLPMILLPSMMLLSTLLWTPLQRITDLRKEKKQFRKRILQYEQYLEELGIIIEETINKYKNTIYECFPNDYAKLLYQKNEKHDDYLTIRLGIGDVPFNIELKQNFRLKRSDPILIQMNKLKESYSFIKQIPVILSLKKYRYVALSGATYDSYLSYILKQLCTFHHPQNMPLILLADEQWILSHHYVLCIPHLKTREGYRIATSVQQMKRMIADLNPSNYYVVICQKQSLLQYLEGLFTAIILCDDVIPQNIDLKIVVNEMEGYYEDSNHKQVFRCDDVSFDAWTHFYQLQFFSMHHQSNLQYHPSFYDLYQCESGTSLNVYERWIHHRTLHGCIAKLGLDESGDVFEIDFHEKSYGPHGLIAGTTGSGKSELIITMILSLLVTYSPRELQLVLIDFKGGGVLQVFDQAAYTVPHIAGVFSNLNINEMERALVSFRNEVHRREILFQKLSEISQNTIMNIDSYQKYWLEEYQIDYLAHLLIFVDEFAELKREKPDFMNELISLARVGRSLGMHLILSTQKPAGVVDDQIWSNSRFKICLKVQDAQDSMEIIHCKDACHIHQAGELYLLCDGVMSHIYSGYSGVMTGQQPSFVKVLDYDGQVKYENTLKDERNQTQVAQMITQIREADLLFQTRAHQLWLPELLSIDWNELNKERQFVLGKIDDYYQHQYSYLSLNTNCAVFSIEREEKIKFLKVILASIVSSGDDTDEIYIIDDLSIQILKEFKHPKLCQIFTSNDVFGIKRLFTYLNSRECNTNSYLIITDLACFQNENESLRTTLHHLLEHSDQYRIRIVLFMTTFQVISYRDLSLISLRISLMNQNLQDLSGIFECNVKRIINKPNFGLIKQKNILEFVFPSFEENELMDILTSPIDHKNHLIPILPSMIQQKDCLEDGIAIGMDIETCNWITVKENQTLFVLATYEDELDKFGKVIKGIYIHDDKNVIASTGIYMMTLSTYQFLQLRYQNDADALVYIGSGFKDQYQFTTSYRGMIHENMGVYYYRGRNKVIQIAEA